MIGNAAFAVPKDRQEVTLRLDSGETLEGEVFIEHASADPSIHQKVTTFLEDENRFFPLKITSTGKTVFVNKTGVRVVEVAMPSDPASGFFAHLLMQTIPVAAHFRDGSIIRGDLTAEVPKEKARLSDCLNLPDKFLCIRTGTTMCYVNRDALGQVTHADAL